MQAQPDAEGDQDMALGWTFGAVIRDRLFGEALGERRAERAACAFQTLRIGFVDGMAERAREVPFQLCIGRSDGIAVSRRRSLGAASDSGVPGGILGRGSPISSIYTICLAQL
jgi:hypothetical protein